MNPSRDAAARISQYLARSRRVELYVPTIALLSLLFACTSPHQPVPSSIASPRPVHAAVLPDDSLRLSLRLMVLALSNLRRDLPEGELLVEAVPGDLSGRVAAALQSRASTRAEALSCDPAGGPASCRVNDAVTFARVAAPDVGDATASVRVDVWYEHRSTRQPVVMRRYLVRLERLGTTWRVASQELVETT